MRRIVLLCAVALVLGLVALPASFGPRLPAVKKGTSNNWAGYVAESSFAAPAGVATTVQGMWTVPAVRCGFLATTYSAVWVGLDGYSSGTVEQLGTGEDCVLGTPSYYVWWEMYPNPSHTLTFAVRPGDTVGARVQYRDPNQYVLTFKNFTTGRIFTITQPASAQRLSAEWIVEAPAALFVGVLPLANFGSVTFQHASAILAGHSGPISDPAWQNDSITMVAPDGTVKTSVSPLTSDGGGFTVTWRHK